MSETEDAIQLKLEVPGVDQVQADYKDGILTLTTPKNQEERNKVVKVNYWQKNASCQTQSSQHPCFALTADRETDR